ncbi:hypothetical protein C2R22_15200 [Salinigranum rubrum]|uniref:Uncharacterized protein n=1 Tax=Salinigranum rubrum TaxID=755307 RepID=A0A2I8VLM3_9EURY|nr:hypothetical protein [Salinigranum rubrum]AUV82818.1 hypothetical protein C2R22_15200 [Salinigranum rubrum]
MFRRLRKNGSVFLVPLAWTFVTAAHLDLVARETVLVAHVVMTTVFVLFTAASWSEMRSGVLYAWKLVLVTGTGFTLVGLAALVAAPAYTEPVAAMLSAWMLVPAAAYVYTARNVAPDEGPPVYRLAAALSVLGWVVYFLGPLLSGSGLPFIAGLTLVNVGQTVGIAYAGYRY